MPFDQYISTPLGASIALWHLTEEQPELSSQLTEDERKLIESRRLSPKRFCEQAATRLLLNSLKETRDAQIAYAESGKPYLLHRPGHLSISHSGQWVAIAYHPLVPIGIDIEQIGTKVERVAERVLNDKELNAYGQPLPTHIEWLHLCWSAKEALFKAIPEGGIDFRAHLHLSAPLSLDKEGTFTARETRTAVTKEYTLWYRIFDPFVLVCAVPLQ